MISESRRTQLSKFLSLVLRHQPDKMDLELQAGGWADLDAVAAGFKQHGDDVDQSLILALVQEGPKNRFEISPDGKRIRARYGHSLDVDLDYTPRVPPDVLYHGTARRFLEKIRGQGVQPQGRTYVHLSSSPGAAREVGSRHGTAVILEIDAPGMFEVGYAFYPSTDRVWLVDDVPPRFLSVLDAS